MSPVGKWCMLTLSMVLSMSTTEVQGVPSASSASCNGEVTLFQSESNKQDATIRFQNCTTLTIRSTVDSNSGELTSDISNEIETVETVPEVPILYFYFNNMTKFEPSNDDLSMVTNLVLANNLIQSFNDIKLPPKLTSLDLSYNYIRDFSGWKAPETLTNLFIGGNYIKSLAEPIFPSKLSVLYAHNLRDFTLEGANLPESLTLLSLSENGLTTLSNVIFPEKLTQLDLSGNKLTEFPTNLPSGLNRLGLRGNAMEEITQGNIIPASLSFLNLAENKISKISGVRFPLTLTELNLTANDIQVFNVAASDVRTLQNATLYGSTSVKTCEGQGTKIKIQQFEMCVFTDEEFASLNPQDNPQNASSDSSSISGWVLPVVLCAVVIVLGAIIFVRLRVHKKKKKQKALTLTMNNPAAGIVTASNMSINSMFDVNSMFDGNFSASSLDTTLLKHRIPSNDIVLEKALAKGGYGIIYLAKYQKKKVVVKKILPEKSNDDASLKSFLAEIKLCATLDHPKIVSFLGVSWNTLADVAVVIEHMPNGDLDALLKSRKDLHRMNPHEFDWYSSSGGLPPKLAIAVDVVEAIVYLHSFNSPIIHRDLKSKNVLLNDKFGAKLSDFGVSREWSVDTTMTAGIGTMAWIAPEVLRGERYTEKADIYSFGVILTELATHEKPFDGVTNALVVLKVTSGEERPEMGPYCPEDVRELANRCLSFNALDRPSAMVIHYELKSLLRLHTSYHSSSRRGFAVR